MYLLDLCCGTQSIKAICNIFKMRYIGLDINKITDKKEPDICINLLDWDYKEYFKLNGHPCLIWFSPPCREYSILNNAMPHKIPDIIGSNKIVKRGLEIIEYCTANFVIENPNSGKLKEQVFMKDIPYTIVDYCSYGFPYKKRTRLWNNINFIGEKCKINKCEFKKGKRHLYSIGNATYNTNVGEYDPTKTRLGQRYSIPPKLLKSIFQINQEYNGSVQKVG